LAYNLKELEPMLNAFPAPFISDSGILENLVSIIKCNGDYLRIT